MFKQAFRLAFVALIWKQYKVSIVSTLILFAYLYLVGSVHADYLKHASLQNDGSATGMSFIIKWLALGAGVIIYALFHFLSAKRSTRQTTETKKDIAKQHSAEHGEISENDPFREIRERETLRGPGDFLINEDKK